MQDLKKGPEEFYNKYQAEIGKGISLKPELKGKIEEKKKRQAASLSNRTSKCTSTKQTGLSKPTDIPIAKNLNQAIHKQPHQLEMALSLVERSSDHGCWHRMSS